MLPTCRLASHNTQKQNHQGIRPKTPRKSEIVDQTRQLGTVTPVSSRRSLQDFQAASHFYRFRFCGWAFSKIFSAVFDPQILARWGVFSLCSVWQGFQEKTRVFWAICSCAIVKKSAGMWGNHTRCGFLSFLWSVQGAKVCLMLT